MSQISEKFAKDLDKFNEWLETNGYVIKRGEMEKQWGLNLLENFKEQGRNKLEHYVKELMKQYTISREDDEVEDYKLLVKEFKEYKPKKGRNSKPKQEQKEAQDEIAKLAQKVAMLEMKLSDIMEMLPKPVKEDKKDKIIEKKVKIISEEQQTSSLGEIDLDDISDIDFSE
jgi:hypothetical protein